MGKGWISNIDHNLEIRYLKIVFESEIVMIMQAKIFRNQVEYELNIISD